MAGSAELVRLVDLVESDGASRNPTKAIEFSPQVTQFFFNIIGFLLMGFLAGDFKSIFRPFFEIFVAKPTD